MRNLAKLRIAVNDRHYCAVCQDRPLREPWEWLSGVCDACHQTDLTDGEKRLLKAVQESPEADPDWIDPEEADDGGTTLVAILSLLSLGTLLAILCIITR